MTKITTKDCKEFLANFQARNPQLEQARFNPKEGDWDYEETIKLLKSAVIAKNWKRLTLIIKMDVLLIDLLIRMER